MAAPAAPWDDDVYRTAEQLVGYELATDELRRALTAEKSRRAAEVARREGELRRGHKKAGNKTARATVADVLGDVPRDDWAACEVFAVLENPPADADDFLGRLDLVPGWADRARAAARRLGRLEWIVALACGEEAARAAAAGGLDALLARFDWRF